MLKKLILILLLVCTTSINSVFAESIAPTDTSIKADTLEITTTDSDLIGVETKEGLSELEAYKLLYENQKEANAKILDTTFWALGLAVTVLIFILGANLLNNVRSKRNETELLSSQFNNQLEEIRTHFLGEIKELTKHELELYKKTLSDDIKEELKTFNRQLDLIKDSNDVMERQLKEIIDSSEKIIKNKITQLESEYKQFRDSNKKEITDFKQETKNSDLYLEGLIEINEADSWRIRAVESNALMYYASGVINLYKSKRWGDIESALGMIIKLFTNGHKPSSFHTGRLNEMLLEIEKEDVFRIHASKIRELIAAN
jgi:hypothetical protein